MSDAEQILPESGEPRLPALLIAVGVGLTILSIGGLALLAFLPAQGRPEAAAGEGTPETSPNPGSEAAALPIGTPGPTPSPTLAGPVTPTRPAGTPPASDGEAAPTVTGTLPLIEWTEAEKNALSWLCYYEVGGMGEARVDACLSVISTVRARYAYPNGFTETDVIGTLTRPGQFNIEFETDRPAPDSELYWVVEQYQYGMRGSCNGYLYFDSVPGGPSLCVIRSSNGQFMEFHNGWR